MSRYLDNTPTAPTLSPSDLTAFDKLGIPPALLAEAHVQRVTDAEARLSFGIKASPSQDLNGIVFPYFSPVTGHRTTARLRRDHPEIEDGKPKDKYLAPYGDPRHLYILPSVAEKLKDLSIPVALVESEKASLSLFAWSERTGTPLLVMALGGCWGWRGVIGKTESTNGERVDVKGPLPDLSYCDGRKVFVLLDTNAATNPKVQQARAALSTELRSRRCEVLVCDLPGGQGINGPDDYLSIRGDVAMAEVLASARPPEQKPALARTGGVQNLDTIWSAEGMDTFLADSDAEMEWLVADILAPGCLTQLFAPRGLGKSVLAEYWAVKLASSGKRVLILDRDNPRHTLKQRLRALGAGELDLQRLKIISRENCPPLTNPEAWWSFPYADYDLVIVDSLDSMAEGVGEQDSAKPARAMAPLLDLCHRENGPAVLLLGNTIKSAAHSRGSGVVEDRADIVYEVRDATDFHPTGPKSWPEELPAQGASEWATRSARRTRRATFRLALIATKFRAGEEPAPRMYEISTVDEPWTVTDVTAVVDAAGEAERQRVVEEKTATISKGVAVLQAEISSRYAAGKPALLKKEAESFLMAVGIRQKTARQILKSDVFLLLPGTGPGHPLKVVSATEIPEYEKPNIHNGFTQTDFGHPLQMQTTEINPIQTPMDKGDFGTASSVVSTLHKGEGDVNFTAEELEEELRI